jgi:hypothetical protein
MQYALLIYADATGWDDALEAERRATHERYAKLTRDLRDEGKLLGGEQLQPVTTATAVQVRAGDTLVTDGPFAETKETLGGFYLIEAASLDEAIDWAARIPAAAVGTIEVRPVVAQPGNGA